MFRVYDISAGPMLKGKAKVSRPETSREESA